jgi:hypothetical protein
MPRRHHKPSDPQELARRRAERAATEVEIGRLRGLGATVNLDRARRIVSAYRASPFHKLRDSNTITRGQAAAAEKLCEQWATWKGLDGKPALLPGVQVSTSAAEFVTDRMLTAGKAVRAVLERVGPMNAELLAALVVATVEEDAPLPWRDIVRRVAGITQTVRQSQVVADALENLARAYQTRSLAYAGQPRALGTGRADHAHHGGP